MIATLRLSRVAVLYNETLLPCVGNDAYSGQPGTLCSELEVYGSTTADLLCIQQRAPAATGRQQAFAEDLCKFLLRLQPRQVQYPACLEGPNAFEGSRTVPNRSPSNIAARNTGDHSWQPGCSTASRSTADWATGAAFDHTAGHRRLDSIITTEALGGMAPVLSPAAAAFAMQSLRREACKCELA